MFHLWQKNRNLICNDKKVYLISTWKDDIIWGEGSTKIIVCSHFDWPLLEIWNKFTKNLNCKRLYKKQKPLYFLSFKLNFRKFHNWLLPSSPISPISSLSPKFTAPHQAILFDKHFVYCRFFWFHIFVGNMWSKLCFQSLIKK